MSIDAFSPLTTSLIFTAATLIGLIFLVLSADKFVQSAASVAKACGMSTLLIGLTIVAFGTSAPEILVSATAALEGRQGLSIGNALGSNIANIGLVLGCTALFARLPVSPLMKRDEIPALIIVTLMAGLLFMNHYLGRLDGIILLSGIVILSLLLYKKAIKQAEQNSLSDEVDEIDMLPKGQAILWLVVSLAILLISAKSLVWGASGIALQLGVSELVIGLTIVAIGTSLPELAASVAGVLKGHHDLAIGNVVGSNILNLLAVLAVPALFAPGPIDEAILDRDYPIMLGFTLLFALAAYSRTLSNKESAIDRYKGGILLIGYVSYLLFLGYINL